MFVLCCKPKPVSCFFIILSICCYRYLKITLVPSVGMVPSHGAVCASQRTDSNRPATDENCSSSHALCPEMKFFRFDTSCANVRFCGQRASFASADSRR